MSRRRRVLLIILAGILVLATFAWVNNSSWLHGGRDGRPWLLAHRGLAQTFDFTGITGDTCTARRIHRPAHPYLENTIPSMRAAFRAGADQVEFDVRRTEDDRFAVFHDDRLECRTNGHGPVSAHTLAELRRLDIGYGYTPDGGASFPFRGNGVGLLPSLDDVLGAFPGRQLLIHVKSDDPADGVLLARHLSTVDTSRITVYGGDRPIAALSGRLPGLRVMSREITEDCLLHYELVGWLGIVPGSCAHRQLHIPEGYAPWLWGWPEVFLERMSEHGTRVILVAGDGSLSQGFDTPADLRRLPPGYPGGVWTNRIDVVAPRLTS